MNVEEFINYLIDEVASGRIKADDKICAEYMEDILPVAEVRRIAGDKPYVFICVE